MFLTVRRAEHRAFAGNSELAADPAMRTYLSDMAGPYGLALNEDLLDAGAGHSYGEMAEPLIKALVPDPSPVDLLVLAYGIHDIRLGRATATYLGGCCPGDPLSFAVCDQGVAAAFTALRLIGAYAHAGSCQRAVLVVAEQSALHYELAAPAPVPERNAAVSVLLEPASGTESVNVAHHAEITPDQVGTRLRAAAAQSEPMSVILGSGLTWPAESTVDIIRAPEGQPYTGVWWELSSRLAGWQETGHRVLLADYDPGLQYLCTAVFAIGPAARRARWAEGGTEVSSMAIK